MWSFALSRAPHFVAIADRPVCHRESKVPDAACAHVSDPNTPPNAMSMIPVQFPNRSPEPMPHWACWTVASASAQCPTAATDPDVNHALTAAISASVAAAVMPSNPEIPNANPDADPEPPPPVVELPVRTCQWETSTPGSGRVIDGASWPVVAAASSSHVGETRIGSVASMLVARMTVRCASG